MRANPPFEHYDAVDSVPDGLTWKPAAARPSKTHTTLYSLGNYYKLVRCRETGEVCYYKALVENTPKSPAESIDAEPVKTGQVRYNVGKQCWFIVAGRWFCCLVVKRGRGDSGKTITIRPVTGWDAERVTAWPYNGEIEFGAYPSNNLFQLLRPLKARKA